MKKLLGILVLGLLWCNILIAEEYLNSWKMDIHCKQGSHEWYESAFVVNVENNEFSLGPYNRWQHKNFKWKGKIKGNKISISETFIFSMFFAHYIKGGMQTLCNFYVLWISFIYYI